MSNAPHNSWAMCTHDYTYFVVKCKLSENEHKLEPVNWFNYKEETTVTKQGQLRTGSNSDSSPQLQHVQQSYDQAAVQNCSFLFINF